MAEDAGNKGFGKRTLAVAGMALMLLSTAPVFAFDCAKAVSAIDKAICADETARAANDRMGQAYGSLRVRLGADGRKLTLDGQRAWLAYRDGRCGAGASCLAEQSAGRADTLEKTPAGMAPVFLFQPGKPDSYEVTISAFRFESPQGRAEAAFNAWLDDEIKDTPFGDPPDNSDPHDPYEHDASMDVTRRDSRMISAVLWSSGYTGGAHPNSWSRAFNADRKTGVLYDPAAHFDDAALADLALECARSLISEQSDAYGDVDEAEALKRLEENFPGAVAEGVKSGQRWHFDSDGGHVRFDSYAVAPYSSGSFECAFPYARLRKAAPDAAIFAAPAP